MGMGLNLECDTFFAVLLSLILDGFDQHFILILALSTLTISNTMQLIYLATSDKILRSQDSNPGQLGWKANALSVILLV